MSKKDDEADALAVNCGRCWTHPGEPCKQMTRKPGVASDKDKKTVHPERVDRARRRGALGGAGRALLKLKGKT